MKNLIDEVNVLVDLGWVKLENGVVQLNLPVIRGVDKKPLTRLVIDVSKEVSKVIIDNVNEIVESCKEFNYCQYLEGLGDYLQMAYHILIGLTVKRLIEENVLPKIPFKVALNWGVWMWDPPWMFDRDELSKI